MSLGAPSAFFNGENSSSRRTSHTAKSLNIINTNGGVTVRVSDLRSRGRGFDSR